MACLLGMACKEVMVTAPLLVLLYDRTFLAGSFAEAWRQRWKLYLGLAATWGLLAYLVFSTGLIGRQPELGAPAPWSYARTQPGAILHYLRLCFWPSPLCLKYDWPVASTLAEILPKALALGLLVAATLWGLLRRKAWGYLGAWFLLILAPTSSVVPLTDLLYEHRMYLSLAAVAAIVVAGGYALWDALTPAAATGRGAAVVRWAAPMGLCAAVLLALGYATARRNLDYRSTVALWQDVVDQSPHDALARYNLANALFDAGRIDEAVEHYHEGLRVKPRNADLHNGLGLALARLGKIDEAIEHYQEALRLTCDHAQAHNNLASVLAAAGRADEAIEHYREALRVAPDYADAHHNLGIALAGLGRDNEAIEHYREALRLNPDSAEARSNLGLALAATGRTDEAIELYREALRLNPRDAEAHNGLGSALLAAGKTDEAIKLYREALRLKPDFAQAHNNLGLALAAVGKTDEAIEHYRRALRAKADDDAAYYNLGNVLANLGKTGEAIEHFRQAVRLKPDHAEAHHNLAALLMAMGKTEEAVDHFTQACRLKPDFALAHYHLGSVLAGMSRPRDAIEHYERFLEAMPESKEGLNNLAWLLATNEAAQGGDPARAVRLAQRSRELAGQESAGCLDTLAAAYAAAGRFEDAVMIAQTALQRAESAGQAPLAQAIRARLELYRAGQPYYEPQPARRAPTLPSAEDSLTVPSGER